ncbi:MAG: ferrochelatase [Variovorax paradoxus]|uniref:Ferrochelatase n=1 Tax=Variovorax paradoxus TaxID=34073 RepID=A0A2W5QD21_VARPD|nr:MAG: ferrochelatase [Variovorax paradoxus]
MPRFRPEPLAIQSPPIAASRTAVLWCNLGSPTHPTAAAVRPFLAQFLSDPRVVELPALLWQPILRGAILPRRPAASAAKYQSIWTPEGSPLTVWTHKQASLLQGWLGERGHKVVVLPAMRYGAPSVDQQLEALKAGGIDRVLVLQAYPQYSATTTASMVDAVNAWSAQARRMLELRFVNDYHDDPGYIDALAASVQAHWRAHGQPDRLVMSFHGIPERNITRGDPYEAQCRRTAEQLIERLQWRQDAWVTTFQSRFGRARWLQPYTEPTLREMGRSGVGRVDVLCPGFPADCLETLEEIAMEGRAAFLESGGKEFHYIPALNDDAGWITALAGIAERHLAGWPTRERFA